MSKPVALYSQTLQAKTAILPIPVLIYRYVKPSHVNDGEVSDEAFQLRENRSPPEEYISFYFSKKTTHLERLQCVENVMCSTSSFSFSKNGGLLEINTVEALEEVNQVRELIKFEHKPKKQKVGMHYLSKDPVDTLEARTTLAFLSQFTSKKQF